MSDSLWNTFLFGIRIIEKWNQFKVICELFFFFITTDTGGVVCGKKPEAVNDNNVNVYHIKEVAPSDSINNATLNGPVIDVFFVKTSAHFR